MCDGGGAGARRVVRGALSDEVTLSRALRK